MENKIRLITKKLKKYPNILAVYLFGSFVRGNKGKLSDVDVGIIFENPAKVFNSPKNSLKMYEELFDVFAPLVDNTNKLDLVFLQRTPLSLQKEVVVEGKLLYAKEINKVLENKEKVVLAYLDFKPVINYFHKKIIQRGLYDQAYLQISN